MKRCPTCASIKKLRKNHAPWQCPVCEQRWICLEFHAPFKWCEAGEPVMVYPNHPVSIPTGHYVDKCYMEHPKLLAALKALLAWHADQEHLHGLTKSGKDKYRADQFAAIDAIAEAEKR